jgi:hypothetical protein
VDKINRFLREINEFLTQRKEEKKTEAKKIKVEIAAENEKLKIEAANEKKEAKQKESFVINANF